MLSKNCFFILIASFFIAGFILLALPDTSVGQTEVGCCKVPGGECYDEAGGTCTGNNTWCMTSKARCDTNDNAQFGDPVGTENQWCMKVSMADLCEPQGCCLVNEGPPPGCEQAPETGCLDVLDGTYLGDGLCGQYMRCDPPPQTGCCDQIPSGPSCDDVDITSDECDTLGGMFTVDTTCNVLGECGEPIIVDGCCQVDEDMEVAISIDATCEDTTNVACSESGGMFSPGGVCDVDVGVCDFAPLGCCVFEPNDCDELTEQGCTLEDGRFEGDNVQCSEVPICNIVVSPIPTLNQWGLIAMAGLMGLFSLFIIIRRHRYNLS